MTKDEARDILKNGGSIRFETWTWQDFTFSCQSNEEEGYECCFDRFDNVEDMVDHLGSMCGGRWEEVEEGL